MHKGSCNKCRQDKALDKPVCEGGLCAECKDMEVLEVSLHLSLMSEGTGRKALERRYRARKARVALEQRFAARFAQAR